MDSLSMDRVDPNFKNELVKQPGGENFTACFACGTCTACCPITPVYESFNPRRIIRLALYGFKDEIFKSDFIWFCSSCYACQERCPQGVSITELMTALKNMAFKEGYAPSGIRAQNDLIKGEGRIYPIDDFDNKKRAKAGLPPVPTSCPVVEELFPQ
ncbi:MAG: 4Fe-4S dicluster domain-containing protein [Thermodesulfobacteriota bacterium]|nr:4Fe-4S dicluster domain-containing protein [Thermodesulfobacteriota bacterium]